MSTTIPRLQIPDDGAFVLRMFDYCGLVVGALWRRSGEYMIPLVGCDGEPSDDDNPPPCDHWLDASKGDRRVHQLPPETASVVEMLLVHELYRLALLAAVGDRGRFGSRGVLEVQESAS